MESERLRDMLETYGELCNQETAAKIFCVFTRTIRRMVKDGRLRAVGTRIDVRSMANIYTHFGNESYARFIRSQREGR